MTSIIFDQGAAGIDPWPVAGPLTDAELRASAISVTGPVSTFTDVLSFDSQNIASAGFDQTHTFTNPARLTCVILTFTTTAPRRVQMYRGAQLIYDEVVSDLMWLLDNPGIGFPANATLRLVVAQTASACLMTVRATAEVGSAPLVGSTVSVSSLPALPAGSNEIGKVRQIGLSPIRSWSQFYNLRGQRFLATTGYVAGQQNTATALALFRNPSGSGKWIFIDQAEFGSSLDSRFSRIGGGTATGLGTPLAVGKCDGGTTPTAVGEFYKGGTSGAQYTISSPGTLRKVATMRAYQTYQILQVQGTAILRPGQQTYWTMDEPAGGGNGTYDAFIDLEWVEIDESIAAALVSAMQAYPEY